MAAGYFPPWLVLPSRRVEFLTMTFVITFLLCPGIRKMPIKRLRTWRSESSTCAHWSAKTLAQSQQKGLSRTNHMPSLYFIKLLAEIWQLHVSSTLYFWKMSVFLAPGSTMSVWLVLSSHCSKARFQASALSEWTLHVDNVFVLVSCHKPKTCESGGLETQSWPQM